MTVAYIFVDFNDSYSFLVIFLLVFSMNVFKTANKIITLCQSILSDLPCRSFLLCLYLFTRKYIKLKGNSRQCRVWALA